MRKLKVVHVITGLNQGGAETMLQRLLSKTDRDRFDPSVVSLMNGGTLAPVIKKMDIPVYYVDMKRGRPSLQALWKLVHIVRETNTDLIQGWMYHGNLAGQAAAMLSRHRIPVLWSIHHAVPCIANESRNTAAVIRLCGWMSRLPARIVFVSHAGRSWHEALGYCSRKGCVISNGFDISEFVPSPAARLSVRTEVGLPNGSLLIGLFGRYHPMKDHANFLRAAAMMVERGSSVHFLLAGAEIDPSNPILRGLVEELGLLGRVHLLGERRDMPRLMAALDIAALSSYSEAFPLVVGEAMSCGVPCVVTDVGDTAALVDGTGIVVPPRDPHALANAWQRLLAMGPGGRGELGLSARRRIEEHYSLVAVVRQYEHLYSSVSPS
jgi:glycosyltransferase involved in cell wall biosynthesis